MLLAHSQMLWLSIYCEYVEKRLLGKIKCLCSSPWNFYFWKITILKMILRHVFYSLLIFMRVFIYRHKWVDKYWIIRKSKNLKSQSFYTIHGFTPSKFFLLPCYCMPPSQFKRMCIHVGWETVSWEVLNSWIFVESSHD